MCTGSSQRLSEQNVLQQNMSSKILKPHQMMWKTVDGEHRVELFQLCMSISRMMYFAIIMHNLHELHTHGLQPPTDCSM